MHCLFVFWNGGGGHKRKEKEKDYTPKQNPDIMLWSYIYVLSLQKRCTQSSVLIKTRRWRLHQQPGFMKGPVGGLPTRAREFSGPLSSWRRPKVHGLFTQTPEYFILQVCTLR